MTTQTEATTENEAILAIAAEDAARAGSVVKGAYKLRYAERALTAKPVTGVSKKARARSCGDWLAVTLQKLTLAEKDQIDVGAFEAILDANGVKHDHWNRTTKGWQGRLRMTGRLSLQRIVAEGGELEVPADLAEAKGVATTIVAPASWVKANTH
jgi:hypothetical protein